MADENEIVERTGSGWQRLDGVDPMSPKSPVSATIDGETILIFRVGDGWRGVQRTCPHQNAPLRSAAIVSNGGMIRCSLHAYTFKLSDGKGVNCPGFRIDVYEVREQDGNLFAKKVHQ